MPEFNYIEHYKTDAEEFDYFEKREGATDHDERRLREYIISLLPKSPDLILDIGCGRAWVAEKLLPYNKKIISMDISLINPQKAVEKYPGKNHIGLNADSFYMPFKNNSIQCIIASEIIEHLPYPALFIKECLRILLPGGRLIVSTPYKEKLKYYLCIHCNKKTPANAHIHSFDEVKLGNLLNNENLSSFSWKIFGNKLLIFVRTYIFLRIFPFKIWKLIDKMANLIYNKPVHIIAIYKKK